MLIENCSRGISRPKTIQVRPVVGPERIHQLSRIKPSIVVEVQRAVLDPCPDLGLARRP
jgi:hypothetical protein